jgi:acyl-CoA thioester hydrolase
MRAWHHTEMDPPAEAVQIRLLIRWSDVDSLGHVNNAVYLNYLEEARDRLIGQLFGQRAWDFVLARVAIDYRSELVQDDGDVIVHCGVSGYGRSSIRTWERVKKRDGTVSAEAESVLVARDPEVSKSRPLTEDEKGILDAVLAEAARQS